MTSSPGTDRQRRSAKDRTSTIGPTPTNDVLKQFRAIIRTVRQHYRQVQERCGVSGAQLWALAAVGAGKGMKVNEVARSLSIHQSTASNLCDRLERMKLVERVRSVDDRRVVCVHITSAGRAVLRRAPKPAQGVLPEALEALPPREIRALRTNLDSLLRRMRISVRNAGMTPMSDLLERDEPPSARHRGRHGT